MLREQLEQLRLQVGVHTVQDSMPADEEHIPGQGHRLLRTCQLNRGKSIEGTVDTCCFFLGLSGKRWQSIFRYQQRVSHIAWRLLAGFGYALRHTQAVKISGKIWAVFAQ